MTPQPVSDPTAGFILIVATTRDHHQRLAIGILNLVGGWSVVGWIVALVWACTVVRQVAPEAPPAALPPRRSGTPAPRPTPRPRIPLADELALHAARDALASRALTER